MTAVAGKITVSLTRAQIAALRLAVLCAGEDPTAFGWDPRTAAALRRADNELARVTRTRVGPA